MIRRQKVPLSAAAQHLGPWASAKKELIDLQMALLQKQHEETQRREEETHRREEELFELKKRSLELDIRIKEETLKKMNGE